MKIECDPVRDVTYVWFGAPGTKAATETVSAGVHADFDRGRRLIGLEVLDPSEVAQQKVQFEASLAPASEVL